MAKPKTLTNVKDIIACGIDPKTGLPVKYVQALDCVLKDGIKKQLRIVDEQDAVNRYVWYGLESMGLTSQELERMLYYKGQLCFFYFKELDQFYIMPYALNGGLDFYGRFNTVHPIPFVSGTSEIEKKTSKNQEAVLSTLSLKVQYEIATELPENVENVCVLLHDYTKQLSQTNISRQIINDPILDIMSDAIPMARTALIANSGVKGMRVQSQTDAQNVQAANIDIQQASLSGAPFVPIIGGVEFQELTNGSALKSEEYLLFLQALDNYRLSLYGLDNGGLFQKRSHMLEAEQKMNQGQSKLTYDDGLKIRQNFCDIVNSIWNLGIWCDASPSVIAMENSVDNTMLPEDSEQSSSTGELNAQAKSQGE